MRTSTREERLEAFGRLLDVMDELREKCPWDRKQTNESLQPLSPSYAFDEDVAKYVGFLENGLRNYQQKGK